MGFDIALASKLDHVWLTMSSWQACPRPTVPDPSWRSPEYVSASSDQTTARLNTAPDINGTLGLRLCRSRRCLGRVRQARPAAIAITPPGARRQFGDTLISETGEVGNSTRPWWNGFSLPQPPRERGEAPRLPRRAASRPVTSPSTRRTRVRLFYERGGPGYPEICLHTAGSDSRSTSTCSRIPTAGGLPDCRLDLPLARPVDAAPGLAGRTLREQHSSGTCRSIPRLHRCRTAGRTRARRLFDGRLCRLVMSGTYGRIGGICALEGTLGGKPPRPVAAGRLGSRH